MKTTMTAILLALALSCTAGCKGCFAGDPGRAGTGERGGSPLSSGPGPLFPVDIGMARVLAPATEIEWFEKASYDVRRNGRVVFLNDHAVALDLVGAQPGEALALMGKHPLATASMKAGIDLVCDPGLWKRMDELTTRWLLLEMDGTGLDLFRLAGCLEAYRLDELHLFVPSADDASVSRLAAIPALRGLGLAGTSVSDAGMIALEDLPELRWLVLDNTAVTKGARESLGTALPGLSLD